MVEPRAVLRGVVSKLWCGVQKLIPGRNSAMASHYHEVENAGVVAQLVERLNGIQEVRGSNPLGSSVLLKDSSDDSDSIDMLCPIMCQECQSSRIKEVELSIAIERLVLAKQQSKRRPAYIKSLKQYLNQFSSGRERLLLSSISPDDIELWFSSRSESASAQRSNLGRLGSLFSFAVRRGWVTSNPCDMVEKPTIEHTPPRILTPSECSRLMNHVATVDPDALGWFSLCLFCGVRPSEADRITWASVGDETVVIDAAASKVRRRRIITMLPAAKAWLEYAKKIGSRLPVPYSTRRRVIRRAREALGMKHWPQDILRHTCASFMIAKIRDAGIVSLELGNSPGILLKHYRELVTKDWAESFWSITPEVTLNLGLQSQLQPKPSSLPGQSSASDTTEHQTHEYDLPPSSWGEAPPLFGPLA